jgi:hypothetical protein
MLKLLGWVVPLLVAVLAIQIASDVLYMQAIGYLPTSDVRAPRKHGRPLPVHEIEREASSGGIVT